MRINRAIQRILFRNHRNTLIFFAAFLLGFEIVMHWFMIASSMAKSIAQFVAIAPPAMKRFFFEDSMGLATPASLISLAYTHPFILFLFIAYPALFYHREISSAQEKGLLALVLSKPLSRSSYLLNLITANLFNMIVLGVFAAAGVVLSYYIFGAEGNMGNFMLAIVNLVLLAVFLGGAALLIAVCSTNSGQATGWMIGTPLTLYLAEFLGKSMKQLAFLSPVNPFHYFNPQQVITQGRLAGEEAVFLCAGTIVLMGAAFVGFGRKEI